MKKGINKVFNKLTKLALAMLLLVAYIPMVYAAGSVNISFTAGKSKISVNEEITLTLQIGAINDANPIQSIGGTISFDENVLTLVSCEASSAFAVNGMEGKKIGWMSLTGVGANNAAGTCKFKGKANGTTTVTFESDLKVSDNKNNLTVSKTGKEITVGDSTPVTQPTQPTQPSQPSSEPTTGGGTTTKSNDATLKSLSVEGFDISPAFDPATTSYTIDVPEGLTELKINAEANSGKASINGNGKVSFTIGDTLTVRVVAEDGTPKEYKITTKKKEESAPKDSNNKLKSLDISGYSINPKFNPDKTTYSMNVANSVTGLTVKAIADSDKAKITILGNTGWKEGVNTVTVRVTAEDGSQRDYIINVTRAGNGNTTAPAKSNDNNINDLIIKSAHTMEPAKFNKDVTTYNLTVPYDVDKLDLTPTLSNANAKYTVTGNENFKVGEVNVVQIIVTAEDGSQKVYILNVTRSTDVDKTDVKDITIGGGFELEPKFDPKKLTYTVNVKPGTKELDVTATPIDPESKVEIVGNKNLKTGDNTVLVKVTDKNGYVKYYTLNVVRPERKILGLTPLQFGIITGIILLLLLLILFLLLKRRKKEDKEEEKNVDIKVDSKKEAPVIEFKPEFNFNSRNGTDDDIVLSGGTLTQGSTTQKDVSYIPSQEEKKVLDFKEADYEEVPYDPYDEIVTKDELIDAINEGLESHNPEKLKMLLEQEELNRKKEELRKKEEEEKARRDRY